MTDDLERAGATSRTEGMLSPPEIQRKALRDVVKLAAECARGEKQLEDRYQTSLAAGREAIERDGRDLDDRQKAERERIGRQYADKVRRLHEEFQTAVGAVRCAEYSARLRLWRDRAVIDRRTRQELDQVISAADGGLDAETSAINGEHERGLKRNAAHAAEADSLESQAEQLLHWYGCEWPSAGTGERTAALAEATDAFRAARGASQALIDRLGSLHLARLMVGVTPFVIGFVLCALAGVVTQAVYQTRQPQWAALGVSVGLTAVVCVVLGAWLGGIARGQLAQISSMLRDLIDEAKASVEAEREHVERTRRDGLEKGQAVRRQAIEAARAQCQPILDKAAEDVRRSIAGLEKERRSRLLGLDERKERALAEALAWRAQALDAFERTGALERESFRERCDSQLCGIERQHADDLESLRQAWGEGLAALGSAVAGSTDTDARTPIEWSEEQWRDWTPPRRSPHPVRFGELQVSLEKIAQDRPRVLQLPEGFSMPALLSFPGHASLMLHADGQARDPALQALRTVMLRLLTCVPPGRVRFTIIDPVGRGRSFAGFMHLADYDEALVGGRIWTEREDIEARLAELTAHIETVIQKCLRNEFETIDEYNAQAGELAEPYQFVVVADLPAAFSDEALQRLGSIAVTGGRCGVYMLVLRDTQQAVNSQPPLDQLTASCANLVCENGRFFWQDELFREFPLVLDPPPGEAFLTQILHRVGEVAREAKRVEVPFETIAPSDAQLWSGSTDNEVGVPVGRMGATRLQMVRLGRGVAQHALIAGKTGSGKSTLLHVLVTNLSLWYSPAEVEFYLVDFKKGVEFRTYVTHHLPHARAIAVESDREFGLSVLQRVDAELSRRGTLFRDAGVQDLASYRRTPGAQPMPRTLLIVDEFHEFFSEDDRIAQDARLLLDRLVRQGRAFGIHVLLGSQTIGGSSGLSRSTLGQMAVRIALQTSEADSQMILVDNNMAARLLSRPGEAIYNDAGGLVEANSPFQVAWLPDDERERQLDRMRALVEGRAESWEPAIVFEGNAPADLRRNPDLKRAIEQYPPPGVPDEPRVWLGDPVAIKEPTHIVLRRQGGANVLVVGQREEASLALLCGAMASLAPQFPPGSVHFYVLHGAASGAPVPEAFDCLCSGLPVQVTAVDYRDVPRVIAELAEELGRRQESAEAKPPGVFLCIHGLHRYRMLRRQEDSFSFSSDTGAAPQPDRQLAVLLRDGPPLGIHVIATVDTVASLERTLDRGAIREFDNRVLFQMSANDSSALIESVLANKLGANRALACSEEQGVVEKFRPYGLPDGDWLRQAGERLAKSGRIS